jgi:predicted CopG family antitoxin
MKATTIKVEGELLEELEQAKPPRQSLSAFVRSLLKQAVARRRMVEAADRYAEFVRDKPEERTWLAEWDSADLVTAPKRRRR